MTKVIFGKRVGREGSLRMGCSAVIFEAGRERVLLTRRTDNGQWCLPGGGMEPGESAAEACVREVWEETGLHARVLRLIGVYSNPDQLVVYPDGNKAHIVALSFEAEVTGGELGLSNETSDYGYYTLAEAGRMDIIGNHFQRIQDAWLNQPSAIVN